MTSRTFSFLSILFLSLTTFASAAGVDIITENVVGYASYTRNQKTKDLQEGFKLKAGDEVETHGPSTVDFIWNDKVGYRILGDSKCVITDLGNKILHFEMLEGDVVLNVGTLSDFGGELQVSTPTTIAAVRGTQFLVRVIDLMTYVIVGKGLVEVFLKNVPGADVTQLGPNKVVEIGADTKTITVRDATAEERRAVREAEDVPTRTSGPGFFDSLTSLFGSNQSDPPLANEVDEKFARDGDESTDDLKSSGP